jgi:hypothetical protein
MAGQYARPIAKTHLQSAFVDEVLSMMQQLFRRVMPHVDRKGSNQIGKCYFKIGYPLRKANSINDGLLHIEKVFNTENA